MSWLSALFGGNEKIRQALRQGGVIIDLRTAPEFDQGHIPGSLNIPVDRLKVSITRIRDMHRPVILCCLAGEHCHEAMALLKQAGIGQVIIGGNWESVLKIMNR